MPQCLSWASMQRPEWLIRNIKNFPCLLRRKSWWDFLFWIDLVKEQFVLSMYTHDMHIATQLTEMQKKERNEWRRKTLRTTSYRANQRPQDKLPTFHRLNWSSLSSPIIQVETHLTLSTCSGAGMSMTKRYFKYEQGLTLHVDTGFSLAFLNCPDSSFQHRACQNEFSPTLNPPTNIYSLLSLPMAVSFPSYIKLSIARTLLVKHKS